MLQLFFSRSVLVFVRCHGVVLSKEEVNPAKQETRHKSQLALAEWNAQSTA